MKNGKLDTANQTITFPESPNIIRFGLMSTKPINTETTYKYSIDGDILTLTIEQRDEKNNLNTINMTKFKKVSDATSK